MDFDSSSKFIASLAKFLQSLCNGYVDFDKGVEVIGHIYINVDSDTGKKVDYVLNEKVCKNDNSITFISNSFHAQPAEKPKPVPKKAAEPEKQDEDTIIMDDSGQTVPNSTNVGTLGSYRSPSSRAGPQDLYPTTGKKRPRTPPQLRAAGVGGSPMASKIGMPPSPRYQDSGGRAAKMGRVDIPPSPLNSSVGVNRDDYEGANVFQSGGEDDDNENYSSNFLDDQNSSELDQKPVIDPDISIVKEEYISNQSSCSYSGSGQTSGPGRGKGQTPSAYPVMIHQNPSSYAGAPVGPPSHQQDIYAGSSLEGAGDPSKFQQFSVSKVDPSLLSELANDRGQSMNFINSKRQVEVDVHGVRWYVCTMCERKYKRSQHLNRHLYQCTQIRSYHCALCSYVCYRSDMLRNHMRCVHKITP